MKTIGERIKELRIQKGKTLDEIASCAKTTRQTIHKYENNIITNIPSDKIEAIAKLFHVSPAYLMGWETDSLLSEDASTNTKDITQQSKANFHTPEEAMEFIIRNPVISAYGGYDINKMSGDEIIDFANELVDMFKLIARHHKK